MKIHAIGSVLAVAFVLAWPAAAEHGGISWQDSVPQALEDASGSSRPVLVDVWAVWCAPCKLMEEKVWSDPDVINRVGKFVPLKVDADANEVFTTRYDAEVLPATLVLDGKGRLITRLTGYVAPEVLNRTMDAVTSGYEEYLTLVGGKNDLEASERLAAFYDSCGNPFAAESTLKKALKVAKKKGAAPEARARAEAALERFRASAPK